MIRFLVVAACLLGVAGPGRAQGIDMTKGGQVEVTSDNGMEWHQNEQQIIAKGNAKAVRGTVTVTADTLTAFYRRKVAAAGAEPAAPAAAPAGTGAMDTGNNEVYRLGAEGNVHIFTATDQAFGDHAVYDIDQAVLVMTGHDLHIITPQQVMTARDVMEYWSQKHMAVGRGNAVVITNDGRRLSADILVGYTADGATPAAGTAQQPVQKVGTQPAVQAGSVKPGSAKAGSDSLADQGGKLQRVDAFGHVEVRTATDIIHADKGVYIPDTQIARLAGNVHMTRGQNELNGDQSVIDLRTGISTLTRNPGSRVEGLVVPNDPSSSGATKPGSAAVKP